MRRPQGVILYQGPSALDGEPIVVIATFKSRNAKTGDMIQTWILRADMSPLAAIDQAADISICGNCLHRPANGNSCYVQIGQAPETVYRAFLAGRYPHINSLPVRNQAAAWFNGRRVRLGAYGDPAACPPDALEWILSQSAGWTGYTHQIDHKALTASHRRALAAWVMVSADSPRQAAKYQAAGFRTFRVRNPGDGLLPGEMECAADSLGASCLDCQLCDGNARQAPSIAIDVHGGGKGNFRTADILATG